MWDFMLFDFIGVDVQYVFVIEVMIKKDFECIYFKVKFGFM